DVPDASGALGADVLLVEDHLLVEGRAAPAVLLGPADAVPTGLAHPFGPGDALLDEAVLVARAATPAELLELADEVRLEPRAHLGPERLFFSAERKIHAQSPMARATRSRCIAGLPKCSSPALARLK